MFIGWIAHVPALDLSLFIRLCVAYCVELYSVPRIKVNGMEVRVMCKGRMYLEEEPPTKHLWRTLRHTCGFRLAAVLRKTGHTLRHTRGSTQQSFSGMRQNSR